MTRPTQTEPLQLSVSNFGPIAKANIDLRPLTVFVGPSNTGKSYLAILIYALHRFFDDYISLRYFRLRLMHSAHGSVRELQLFDDDVKRLARWIRDVVPQLEDAPPIQLPDFIMSMVRPLLGPSSNFSEIIAQDIEWSFGITDAARLIRHGNREGAKITLCFKPFAYELALKRGSIKGSVTSISEETPLYIDSHIEEMAPILFWVDQVLNNPVSPNDPRWRHGVENLISEFFNLALSDVVSPLNNAAHYLPADRTGVMHAHRAVVASLIQRASQAGIRRNPPLPALSGVLADFLENLVKLSDLPRTEPYNENFAVNLERQILKGEIQRKDSETGYPMFSYQPQGWGEDLPLMNSSSMVSELAPVVLYLRYIVEPGDVLIIEEPESHLHPKMQVEFIRQLAAIVNVPKREGVQLLPVAVCGGKFRRAERRRLSQHKIRFRGKHSNIQLLKCGDSLIKALPKGR